MTAMTERQARDWPAAVAEAQQYVFSSTVPTDLHEWRLSWQDETRPGRGSALHALWLDGEYVVEIAMDVYGSPNVAVAETTWLHASADEECPCSQCAAERKDEAR